MTSLLAQIDKQQKIVKNIERKNKKLVTAIEKLIPEFYISGFCSLIFSNKF